MEALVYGGPGLEALEDRPQPMIPAPGDAIVKIVNTTICGTDLHILEGDVDRHAGTHPLPRGRGHHRFGRCVTAFHPGDHALSSSGKCEYCRRGMYSHCTTGSWLLDNAIDGKQAEFVRIPHADTSPIPDWADDDALVMLSDILPTGFKCGVLNGKVARGSTVATVGAGPIRPGHAPDSPVLLARADHHDRFG